MADEEEAITGEIESPGDSKPWLALIAAAEKSFQTWQDKAASVERLYGDLERLANTVREREFQLFWANVQVLGPSIYSKPPVPVVIPKFKDRSPLNRTAAEVLERCSIVTADDEDLNDVMKLVRDDLTTIARGQVWLRLEDDEDEGPEVCIEHLDRTDFLHDPARNWKDVAWVARRGWLTHEEFKKRFPEAEMTNVPTEKPVEATPGYDDKRTKIPVWEIWHKPNNRVVWVSEGFDKVLDDGPPHLTLDGFFPCPKPAYATLQKRTLIPIPDFLFYKDQIEEINETTARIGALTDGLKLRGFYPGGAGELADAIEQAIKLTDNNQVLIPISNWALLGGQNAKDMIVWMPIEVVAATITGLIELRKQLIDDVYQIMGLSDIMRGSTNANETLGAQELKSQYGSVRIRDKQEELVRFARDVIRIAAEIMAENFDGKRLLEMAQMQLPTAKEIAVQAAQINAQIAQIGIGLRMAQSNPEVQAMAQQDPEGAQKAMQEAQKQVEGLQQQLGELEKVVTIDAVSKLLKAERLRCFALDIETDSTIAPDENAQKQRATEYITAMTGLLSNAMPAVQAMPQAAPLMADVIRFANSQFRVGRTIEASVEEFTDQMKEMAKQPKVDPAVEKAKADAAALQEKLKADMQALEAKTAAELELKRQEAANAEDIHRRTLEANAQKHEFEMQRAGHEAAMREKDLEGKQLEQAMGRERHEQSMAASKAVNDQKLAEGNLAAGIPVGYSFDEDREQFKAIMQVMDESRQTTAQVLAVVSEGQKEIADGMKALAAAQLAPTKIVSPEGRTFIKQPMVN